MINLFSSKPKKTIEQEYEEAFITANKEHEDFLKKVAQLKTKPLPIDEYRKIESNAKTVSKLLAFCAFVLAISDYIIQYVNGDLFTALSKYQVNNLFLQMALYIPIITLFFLKTTFNKDFTPEQFILTPKKAFILNFINYFTKYTFIVWVIITLFQLYLFFNY